MSILWIIESILLQKFGGVVWKGLVLETTNSNTYIYIMWSPWFLFDNILYSVSHQQILWIKFRSPLSSSGSSLVPSWGSKSGISSADSSLFSVFTVFNKCRSISRCLFVLGFWNVNLGVYYKLEKKSISKHAQFFVEFELDFYCLCSMQKRRKNTMYSAYFFILKSLYFTPMSLYNI